VSRVIDADGAGVSAGAPPLLRLPRLPQRKQRLRRKRPRRQKPRFPRSRYVSYFERTPAPRSIRTAAPPHDRMVRKIRSSPLVPAFARENNVDLSQIPGTAPVAHQQARYSRRYRSGGSPSASGVSAAGAAPGARRLSSARLPKGGAAASPFSRRPSRAKKCTSALRSQAMSGDAPAHRRATWFSRSASLRMCTQ